MLEKIWETLLGYLKGKLEGSPYRKFLEPVIAFLALFLAVAATAYGYIEWQYHLALPIPLFLGSYLFAQIGVCFAAIALLIYSFGGPPPSPQHVEAAKHLRWPERLWRRISIKRLIVMALIVTGAVAALAHLSPVKAGPIRVRFLNDPGAALDKFALVYLLYELNRMQSSWQFEIDFDTFDPAELRSAERAKCDDQDLLCFATLAAGGRPFIGITTATLGDDAFWKNSNFASVVSFSGFDSARAPSAYEYLAYTLVVQSMLIHLNTACGGPPPTYFAESSVASGDLFQFSPRRGEMRAQVMAGHLTQKDQALLLKCFGIEYMNSCSQLISLDWMRSKRVADNLRRAFGIDLAGAPVTSASPN
ncbi:MAG TPA: hypothetical protein VHR45_03780 [Thermoanaerobaculia bacterium]|nr:hypothetical protein [Thermoanaerobaculia bacterium]